MRQILPKPGNAHRKRISRIVGAFAARQIEMLESPAFRVLSLSAHRVLARIEIEFSHHGGTDNGNLPVTFDNFVAYGIDRHSIGPAIRELVALGFLEVTVKGRAGNADWRAPNRFRITYKQTNTEPTHEWRKFETIAAAEATKKAARKDSLENKKQKPVRINPAANGEMSTG